LLALSCKACWDDAVSGTCSNVHPPNPQIHVAARAATSCRLSAERPACIVTPYYYIYNNFFGVIYWIE
jgi:hypothetical protein